MREKMNIHTSDLQVSYLSGSKTVLEQIHLQKRKMSMKGVKDQPHIEHRRQQF